MVTHLALITGRYLKAKFRRTMLISVYVPSVGKLRSTSLLDLLVCVGLVRSIPSEEYLATVDDECTGSITCLSCTQTTRDQVTVQRMCTGGLELKLWDQLPSSKVKKRSR